MTRGTWNTYRTTGYFYDAANDQRSAGGVHHHQVRKTRGGWQKRILQSNGRFSAPGDVEPITDSAGEACFGMAQQAAHVYA